MTHELQVVRCFISGRVQGVFFRASTVEKASGLGLHGFARNLRDGRVEVLLAGSPEKVQALIGWLWEGPAGAEVTGVVIETTDEPPPSDFAVAPTL